jgi:hypothetical protein
MKYIKKFENLNNLKMFDRLLSDEKFEGYANEFEDIIETYQYYFDEGYTVGFCTTYGSLVYMSNLSK